MENKISIEAQVGTRAPTTGWLRRKVAHLTLRSTPRIVPGVGDSAQHNTANLVSQNAAQVIATTDGAMRSTKERLKSSLKYKNEALSPRVLRRSLLELQAVADKTISEAEGSRRAKAVAHWYEQAEQLARRDVWFLMSEQFGPDAQAVHLAKERYEAALGTAREGAAEAHLRKSLESPRRRLLQRFAGFEGGLSFLIKMRQEWLPELSWDLRLSALDAELEALFSTWFDLAFLELRRISWDSPASLLEKLIRYEAVHDIKSWNDLKNRLDSDRRCYAFFHPRLRDEPLIFVEVALVSEMSQSITSLLDESASVTDNQQANTAIFYSISNTQVGLRGVGFGDSLIKRVVETLKAQYPALKTFATLSPIPGFRTWLSKYHAAFLAQYENQSEPHQETLRSYAARYLVHEQKEGLPVDAVARFHLANGARVERINPAADLSSKGMRQSLGLMVNYMYDLKQIDKNRKLLQSGKIACSAHVQKQAKSVL